MASLVGFMFLDRQNVVADRDIQTPMGQMENAHSHEGQSVVRGGKIVLLGKLAVEPAQIVCWWDKRRKQNNAQGSGRKVLPSGAFCGHYS